MDRRQFFNEVSWQTMKWVPALGLLGFRFHQYSMGPAGGYVGWITWCGKLVGFVPK